MPRNYNTRGLPTLLPRQEVLRRLHEEVQRHTEIKQNEIRNYIRKFNAGRSKYAR